MTKRPGPPPRAASTSTARVELRLTEAERAQWIAAADRECLTLSEFVRASVELALARGSTR